MKKYVLKKYEFLGDLLTPVGVYLALRDHFADCKLLESAEYGNSINSRSIISFNQIQSISIKENSITHTNKISQTSEVLKNKAESILEEFHQLIKSQIENPSNECSPLLVGYVGYNSIKYFDSIELARKDLNKLDIPEIEFGFYEFNILFDHFNNKVTIFRYENELSKHSIEEILTILAKPNFDQLSFGTSDEEKEYDSPENFISQVEKSIHHCKIGDIFQAVISRKFSQTFTGDDFKFYRSLRHINPSPYMFYFDYGSYKLIGSSPESHLEVKNDEVKINPIAGTIKKTGEKDADKDRLQKLIEDPKENSEHDMLIDLARNDLSKHCKNVELVRKKEVQEFSHLYHLVSEVKGTIKNSANLFQLLATSFPAGTLSGAPKYRAMQLIEELETHNRNFYGGAIGFIDTSSNLNMAILIRTACSMENKLTYFAGAGITVGSIPKNELIEIENKLMAIRKAIEHAKQ